MVMRVFLTAHSSRSGGGISVAQNLLAALARTAPEHEYFITIPPGIGYETVCEAFPRATLLSYATTGSLARWRWETTELPRLVESYAPDVLFNIANRGIAGAPYPQVTLIQDPHLFYPESHFGPISFLERARFRYHRAHLRKSLKSTQLLFCQTPVARQRLAQTFGDQVAIKLLPNRVSIFTEQNDTHPERPPALSSVKDRFSLFALTAYYTHKNLEIISELLSSHPYLLEDVAIVLTISPDGHPRATKLLKHIRRKGLESSIVNVGPLPQEALPGYYMHTDALFLPTLLESFSGTYLEAMHFARPILTSDLDFARHVCGDAAMYFDPWNVDSIAATIVRLKDSKEEYDKLIEAGQKTRRDHGSSWDDLATNVVNELDQLIQ